MNMLKVGYVLAMLILPFGLMGQTPRIDKVQRIVSFPGSIVEISGSGFSSTQSDLRVWFGHVKGTILFSSETIIRVQVPPQARLGHVEVINIQSKRVGQSSTKFMLSFNGKQPFTNAFTSTIYNNTDNPIADIFDLCSCDFDGDGRPDIVGTKNAEGSMNLMLLTNQSTVQSNNSSVAFSQSAIPLNVPTYGLACGDLNGDGKPDLVATRGGSTNNHFIYVFTNKSSVGSVSFEAPVIVQLKPGDAAKEVQIHDINRDGRSDIIVTNSQTSFLYVLENKLTSTLSLIHI